MKTLQFSGLSVLYHRFIVRTARFWSMLNIMTSCTLKHKVCLWWKLYSGMCLWWKLYSGMWNQVVWVTCINVSEKSPATDHKVWLSALTAVGTSNFILCPSLFTYQYALFI